VVEHPLSLGSDPAALGIRIATFRGNITSPSPTARMSKTKELTSRALKIRTGTCLKMSEFNYPVTQFRIPEEQNTEIKDNTKTSGMKLRCTSSKDIFTLNYKGKAVPLQAESCPEGSRKFRFQDFMTTEDGGKVVSLTHRLPLPPGNAPGTHFC